MNAAILERALFLAEIKAWTARNERARWWYRTHPLMTNHGGCALCEPKRRRQP